LVILSTHTDKVHGSRSASS